jgi:hypothetical protein
MVASVQKKRIRGKYTHQDAGDVFPPVSKGARTQKARRYHKAKEMVLDEVGRGKTEDINKTEEKRKS